MEVSDPNNVKIYNLSVGKSLPDWLSERKRRVLQKKDIDIRKRIELIQDFDMPGVSTTVKMSNDGGFILATGIYKPRFKCYDVNNLSIKFERGLDSEVVTFEVLSDDYSKVVFLQCDRFLEFHSSQGRYIRLRIPKFGRDLKYLSSTSDLFVGGVGSEIYRLNLERGQFLNSLVAESSEINKLAINTEHHLLVCGTKEGKVEAWDPRSRNKSGVLDCALDCVSDSQLENFPSVTALAFQGGLTMGVGTASGHVLLYDIRSKRPFYVKDHMYGLPIKDVIFENSQNLVLSMDSAILKIWDKNNGKIFTSIESKADFNSLCMVPNSGLMFMANEAPKILTYYIPSLGPAPKWCGFLDNLTEELEESKIDTFYDDYKFVTKSELEDLGLSDLIGTKMLRAYMHGYFIDIRLYKKAKSVSDPFEFDKYKKKKIRDKIEEERSNRVRLQKLPAVNKELASKILTAIEENKKKQTPNLMEDDRFKELFKNPDFQVDKNSEEYRLLNPIVSRIGKPKKRDLKRKLEEHFDKVDDEVEGKNSSEESDSSTDDEKEWAKEVKKQHKLIKKEHKVREQAEEDAAVKNEPKFYEIKDGEEFRSMRHLKQQKINKKSLEERVNLEEKHGVKYIKGVGNREMKFTVRKDKKSQKYLERMKKHQEERRRIMRPAGSLLSKEKPKFWKGQRVQ